MLILCLTVKSAVDEHGSVEHDGRMAKPRQVSAQVLWNRRLEESTLLNFSSSSPTRRKIRRSLCPRQGSFKWVFIKAVIYVVGTPHSAQTKVRQLALLKTSNAQLHSHSIMAVIKMTISITKLSIATLSISIQ